MKRTLILILGLLLFFIQENTAQNALLLASGEVSTGSDFDLIVSLNNSDAIAALQFDINFNKDALVLQTGHLLTDRAPDHSLMVSNPGPGVVRVVVFAMDNATINGTSGDLLNLKFKSKTLPGVFSLSISDLVASSATSTSLTVTGGTATIKVLGPQLYIGIDEVDFGRIPKETNPNRNITIQNQGNQTLELTSASSIYPFGLQEAFPINIDANSSKSLTISLNTLTKGVYTKDLSFVNNDPDPLRKIKKVTLKADVFAVNEIKIGSGSGDIDTEVEIPVVIDNMEAFTGFQFDIALPTGIEYVANSIVESTRFDGHTIAANQISDNTIRFIAFSATNNTFSGNTGEVFSFKLKPIVSSGTYPLAIEDAIITYPGMGNILSEAYNGSISINAPNLYINPVAVSYGNVPITETRETIIRLQNTGDALLIIDEVSFESNALSFDVALPLEIAAGNFEDVTMSFTPSVVGDFAKTVSFRHNGASSQNLLNVAATIFSPNFLMLRNQEGYNNDTNTFEVLLKNNDDVKAVQFDVELPSGFEMDVTNVATTQRTTGYTISASDLGGNTYRVVLYSPSNTPIVKGDTSIVALPVFIAQDVALGDYSFIFSNIIISDINNQNVSSIALETGTIVLVDGAAPTITSTHNDQSIDADFDCQTDLSDYTGEVIAIDNIDTELEITQSPVSGTKISGSTNTITLAVTDDAGNTAEVSFNVAVVDNTSPTITSTHPDHSVDANVDCEATVPDYTTDVTATDNCDSELAITQTPLAGTTISRPTNTITLSVSDDEGNTDEVTFNIKVVDNTNPTITSTHPDQIVDAGVDCEASLPDYTSDLTATDNCDTELTVTQSPVTGTIISGPTNTITLTVTDDAGNTAEVSFNVSVVDKTAPTIISTHTDLSIDPGVDCEISITDYSSSVVATDNCDTELTITQAPVAGTMITGGVNTVILTATDDAGNSDEVTFNVALVDNKNPIITSTHTDKGVESSVSTASLPDYTNDVTATDCYTELIVAQSPVPGTVITGDVNSVTLTVTDDAGNFSEVTFNVSVVESIAPTITSTHTDLSLEAVVNCQVSLVDYTGSVVATDNSDSELAITQTPIAGTMISGATNTVTLKVTDDAGNFAEVSFNVEVVDNTNPTITSTHTDLSVYADVDCEAILADYTGSIVTTDNCATELTVNQSPVAGTVITGATNAVTLTVTDDAGNSAEVNFNVEVVDNTNPTITSTHPDQIVDTDVNCEASLPDYTADLSATDNCDSDLVVSQSPAAGSTISGVTNLITLTVTDDTGNTADVSFNIIVEDNIFPIISCIGDQVVDADETSFYTVSGISFDPSATDDNCGVLSVINDFNSSSTLSGAALPVGINKIIWTVTDNSGNASTCEYDITVNSTTEIESAATRSFLIYPNPATSILTIETDNTEPQLIEITALNGQVIFSAELDGPTKQINLTPFSKGIYFIRVQSKEFVHTEKVVKL